VEWLSYKNRLEWLGRSDTSFGSGDCAVENEVAEILLKINAVSINTVHPFKYASGMLSPIYVDCRVLSSYPNERRVIIDQLVKFTTEQVGLGNIDVIVGTAHSGISLATYLAQKLELPMAYVRTSVKEYGQHRQVEGILKKEQKVLLLSDIMSTEKDIPITVEAIKKAGANIVCCLTIFSNDLGIVESFLRKERIRYHSLTNMETLLSVASERKWILPTERMSALEWMKDPENWDRLRKIRIEKVLKKNKQKISRILLEIKAVTINMKEPYKFASGILSPIYTDNRLLMSYPDKWKKVIDSFISIIINEVGVQNVGVICGTSTAGIPHAAYLAEKLGLPMVYVKSKKDEYGKFTALEGNLKRGDKVLIVEDLVSTGSSSISAARVIREAGGIVSNCLAILTYGMKESIKDFKKEKIELVALTDLRALLEVAVNRNYIKPTERKMILGWIKAPRKWSRK
jgi:orotate phosphoribosyltransferase